MTEKQRKFVEAYMGAAAGNATLAAELAGYSGSKNALAVTGATNLRKPKILAAVQARIDEDPKVADRKQRQLFWTRVMRDLALPLRDRLRASELLARAQGDFVERVHLRNEQPPSQVVLYMPNNNRGPSDKFKET